jgi:hypothetical protein
MYQMLLQMQQCLNQVQKWIQLRLSYFPSSETIASLLPECGCRLSNPNSLWRHFSSHHPNDTVITREEGRLPCCYKCEMRVTPWLSFLPGSYALWCLQSCCSLQAHPIAALELQDSREAEILCLWQ